MTPAVVLAWIPLVLVLDRDASMTQQRLLGIGTWLLLLALLKRESGRTRAQVAMVVAFATLVEYCFAGWLGVYVYRLHDVPWLAPKIELLGERLLARRKRGEDVVVQPPVGAHHASAVSTVDA